MRGLTGTMTEQPLPQEPSQQQQQQTLEFYQAMTDFKNMFPQMDNDVIEAVLRSNNGAVDTTIDQLLSMSTDNENEKIRGELEEFDDGAPKSSKSGKKNKKPETTTTVTTNLSQSMKRWQPPMIGKLPDSFLRITPDETDTGEHNTVQDLALIEDERIAVFLQNEEFMAELRWNEDFLNTLEKDSKLQNKEGNGTEEDVFRERLRNMGKASRRKFAQLSKVFTRRKKRGGRQLLPPTASCDDLLENEETSKARA